MAKIHTIEWTPTILPHPTVQRAMQSNWYGVGGPRLSRLMRRWSRRDWLIGIPGSDFDDHGVPYSLTEEFVAVYRMHPLVPDEVRLTGADGRDLGARTILEMAGPAARVVSRDVRPADMLASLAVARAGRLALHNYPDSLRNLPRGTEDVAMGDEPRIDLASIDVVRDRERAVPRYNDFRRMLRLAPARTFEELTGGDAATAGALRRVYGDVERVDLMIGLYAEPLPDGFGFSETAFHIFVLMASRRLKSDPAFTDEWTPERLHARGHALDRAAHDGGHHRRPPPHPAAAGARREAPVRALGPALQPGLGQHPSLPRGPLRPMSDRIHAITDGTAGRVHAYLLEMDDGVTLIDTLSGDDGAAVLAELARIGRRPDELTRIMLTHAHRSHIRGAAWLRGLTRRDRPSRTRSRRRRSAASGPASR